MIISSNFRTLIIISTSSFFLVLVWGLRDGYSPPRFFFDLWKNLNYACIVALLFEKVKCFFQKFIILSNGDSDAFLTVGGIKNNKNSLDKSRGVVRKAHEFMKTYINISNVPVEIVAEVKRISAAEFDGNDSAAYRKLLREALDARKGKSKTKKERV